MAVLPELAGDAFAAFLFGPGKGEFAAVRVPPGDWIYVDACKIGGESAPRSLLRHYAKAPSLVLLTHPHDDHADGLVELLDDLEDRGAFASRTTRVGVVWPSEAQTTVGHADPVLSLVRGRTQATVSRIFDCWERFPSSRWEPRAGQVESVGDATVRVLSPSEPIVAAALRDAQGTAPRNDWNRLAAVVAVDHEGRRLLLGSDLTETPSRGWSVLLDEHAGNTLPHDLLKMPHHGSGGAWHEQLAANCGRTRSAILVTPFSPSRLPRLDATGALARTLEPGESAHITARPRASAVTEPVGLFVQDPETTDGTPNCVAVIYAASSGERQHVFGPETVIVSR